MITASDLKNILAWAFGGVVALILLPSLGWLMLENVDNRAYRARQEAINQSVQTTMQELKADVKALPDEITKRVKGLP